VVRSEALCCIICIQRTAVGFIYLYVNPTAVLWLFCWYSSSYSIILLLI